MEDEEKLYMITRVRELFRGRFNREEVRRLLDNHKWNQPETVDFVLSSEPKIVTQLITTKSEQDIIGLKEDDILSLNAKKGKIPNKKRQFACEACDNVWWTRVPERKPVSKCKKCKRKFDPVPVDEEYGWARFRCSCGNEFSGFGQKHVTTSECYKCHTMVTASSVQPPEARKGSKTRSRHSCSAPDCTHRSAGYQPTYNERQNAAYRGRGGTSPRGRGYSNGFPQGNHEGELLYERSPQHARDESGYHWDYLRRNHVGGHQPSTCVHPESRKATGKKHVIVPSLPHRSSGSTVDSLMLDDDDASSVLSGYQPSVDAIPEEIDEKEGGGD